MGVREAQGEGQEARGVEGCTLHVEGGTTTWRDAPTCAPALACMPAPATRPDLEGLGRGTQRRRGAVQLRPDRQRGSMVLTGVDFLASPCIPFLILGFRKPGLPLLPLWEKGVGGMRGNGGATGGAAHLQPYRQ